MQRAFNFGAGPAMLPTEVIKRIQDELFDWNGTGVSVMEIGHRTQQFQELLTNLQIKLRKVLDIPENYRIAMVTGGAQGQFDAIPMNILGSKTKADYFVTGTWSKKAADFAKKHAEVNIVTTATKSGIPARSEWKLSHDAAYVYYCPNETVDGIAFHEIPDVGDVPVVADLTSSIAYAPMDYSRFGLAFASAQKNLGIAGVTLVVAREDLINNPKPYAPNVWNYKVQSEQNSSLNTPPVFAIYVMDVMVDWIIAQGGVEGLGIVNRRKVAKLYDYIDNSSFYVNHVEKAYRSELNVPFNLANNEVLPKFLAEANAKGLKYLAGHISVGGGRASLYNAMPESAVDQLIEFMADFARRNG